jgi:hypothetical protein
MTGHITNWYTTQNIDFIKTYNCYVKYFLNMVKI